MPRNPANPRRKYRLRAPDPMPRPDVPDWFYMAVAATFCDTFSQIPEMGRARLGDFGIDAVNFNLRREEAVLTLLREDADDAWCASHSAISGLETSKSCYASKIYHTQMH